MRRAREIADKFGDRLRRLRRSRRLTLDDLSEATGIHRNSIHEWESGKKSPQLRMLICLSIGLKVSPNYLALGVKKCGKVDRCEGAKGAVEKCP
jgi:transcriptional regulator with XRE-family HTH domain